MKLAQPQSEVYSLVGDGSFMMLHSELVTSLQERAKINIVLLDNMANGCINNLQIDTVWTASAPEFRYRSAESGRLQGGLVRSISRPSPRATAANLARHHP
ncbi:3D-(3,5/4)-trihydroxycyclohexane-1,2-dione hydrolase [Raoultella terrigena]|uniref:3D-(3,5/4)-trihydroxycyclohexane-1,2-dione hydrolase n=1 Tax=Raoultella terrigena TaxID=577 RepID=A0A4V6J2D0_RAOTE|nr:3D-(3,5/4)-trihydroxycyclohexane-1,2-dione hydrolase [Raoultella terrigena]